VRKEYKANINNETTSQEYRKHTWVLSANSFIELASSPRSLHPHVLPHSASGVFRHRLLGLAF